MTNERKHEPGGWKRIQLEVDILSTTVDELQTAGVTFRNEVQIIKDGKQILLRRPIGEHCQIIRAPLQNTLKKMTRAFYVGFHVSLARCSIATGRRHGYGVRDLGSASSDRR